MNQLKEQIKTLITQGEILKSQLLPSNWISLQKSVILRRHRNRKASNQLRTKAIGYGAGLFAKSLLGGWRKEVKSITEQHFRNNVKQDKEMENKVLKMNFDNNRRHIESQYISWFAEVKRVSFIPGFESAHEKILDSQYKSKIDTKLTLGINGLKKLIDKIEIKEKNPQNKSLLIKSGEPLKGKDSILNFLHQSKIYLKIQDPHPSKELLRLLEETDSYGSIKIQLLLGKFNKNQKEIFEQELSVLRKTGKNIEVVSIISENNAPFHDRFIINEKSCIMLGTSFNGFGLRDSTINYLPDWSEIEQQFDNYLCENKTIHNGKECKRERL